MVKGKVIENKRILVTGGTGSLGNGIVRKFFKYNPKEIIILSRDENKQYQMQNNSFSNEKRISFQIGDIRDLSRMYEVIKDVDIVIHAAALKHAPISEKEPMEFIKTNVLGTKNIIEASIKNEIPIVIGIGTDKAVKPVNLYGLSKAIQEKLTISENRKQNKTKFINVRYGNVIGSRGSVLPYLRDKILKNETLPITDPSMARFLICLDEAVDLILYAIENGKGGEIFVKKLPAAKILNIARVMAKEMTGKDDYPIKIIGALPGEKVQELLISEEEMRRTEEFEDVYIIHDYGKINEPKLINKEIVEYSSLKAKILNDGQILELLKKADFFNLCDKHFY